MNLRWLVLVLVLAGCALAGCADILGLDPLPGPAPDVPDAGADAADQ